MQHLESSATIIGTALESDEADIIAIYNQAVAERFLTADTQPVTVSSRRAWFAEHSAGAYPIFVDRRGAALVGWCSLSPYRSGRQALRQVAEISYYVHEEWRGRGVGKGLVEHALRAAPSLGFRNLLAILLETNAPSVRLLEANGFARWGHLPLIANFDGVLCGQYVYGRALELDGATPPNALWVDSEHGH
jgi:L-amino acid N-acyltransferase YncA